LDLRPFVEQFESIQERPDGQFVAGLQAGFIDHSAIDPDPVLAPQVAHQDAVVGHRQAAMTPGDLGLVDANVALEVTTHHEDGSVERDDRRRSFDQGGESE
jgi:hypothetical protein